MATATKRTPKLKNKIDKNGYFICNGDCEGQVRLGIVIKGYVYCRPCAKKIKKQGE